MKYIKIFEEVTKQSDLELLGSDTKKVFKKGDLKLFKIDSFDQIKNIPTKTAITYKQHYFDIYNKRDMIHFLFKGEDLKYLFSLDRISKDISLIVDKSDKRIFSSGEWVSDVSIEPEIKEFFEKYRVVMKRSKDVILNINK